MRRDRRRCCRGASPSPRPCITPRPSAHRFLRPACFGRHGSPAEAGSRGPRAIESPHGASRDHEARTNTGLDVMRSPTTESPGGTPSSGSGGRHATWRPVQTPRPATTISGRWRKRAMLPVVQTEQPCAEPATGSNTVVRTVSARRTGVDQAQDVKHCHDSIPLYSEGSVPVLVDDSYAVMHACLPVSATQASRSCGLFGVGVTRPTGIVMTEATQGDEVHGRRGVRLHAAIGMAREAGLVPERAIAGFAGAFRAPLRRVRRAGASDMPTTRPGRRSLPPPITPAGDGAAAMAGREANESRTSP